MTSYSLANLSKPICPFLDPSFQQFLYVDFLRVFILRFCFANMVLQLHRDFRDYPTCQPPLPDADFMESRLLQKILSDLAPLVNSHQLFATASKSIHINAVLQPYSMNTLLYCPGAV